MQILGLYNVRSSFGIEKSVGSNAFDVTTPIDRASLKKGDQVEILKRGSNVVELTAFVNNIVGEYRVEISDRFSYWRGN